MPEIEFYALYHRQILMRKKEENILEVLQRMFSSAQIGAAHWLLRA